MHVGEPRERCALAVSGWLVSKERLPLLRLLPALPLPQRLQPLVQRLLFHLVVRLRLPRLPHVLLPLCQELAVPLRAGEAFRRWKAAQADERTATGPRWYEEDYVLTSFSKRPWGRSPNALLQSARSGSRTSAEAR